MQLLTWTTERNERKRRWRKEGKHTSDLCCNRCYCPVLWSEVERVWWLVVPLSSSLVKLNCGHSSRVVTAYVMLLLCVCLCVWLCVYVCVFLPHVISDIGYESLINLMLKDLFKLLVACVSEPAETISRVGCSCIRWLHAAPRLPRHTDIQGERDSWIQCVLHQKQNILNPKSQHCFSTLTKLNYKIKLSAVSGYYYVGLFQR